MYVGWGERQKHTKTDIQTLQIIGVRPRGKWSEKCVTDSIQYRVKFCGCSGWNVGFILSH